MATPGKLTGNLIGPTKPIYDRLVLDAAVAAAALVATADEPANPAKHQALQRVLGTVEGLPAFEIDVAVDRFDVFCKSIHRRGERGRAEALKAVSDVANDGASAGIVLRIGPAMAQAGRGFSLSEREQIGLIAAAAGARATDSGGKTFAFANTGDRRPFVFTLANAKGGTGKSTTAVHLAVALVKLGHKVGSIDLDGRQGTMSHYLANRASLAEETRQGLGMPRHRRIDACQQANRDLAEHKEQAWFSEALADLADCAYVVIDTPGSDCHLARLGCMHADTLITPLNDSLLDIDILARIDRRKREILGPGEYCKLVWQENDRRTASGRPPIDWIVMRNRLAHVDARNNREVSRLLGQLAQRIGFRLERGLSERVVFRELFLRGLTLLDLPEDEAEGRLQASHVHARQEIDDLLRALGAIG
jgi:chromosome partitioning protein